MQNSAPKDITSYIASAPEESQKKLSEIRKIIQKLVPKAEECISYSMPAFKIEGKPFVGFAGYKKHIGFYPWSGTFLNAYQKELKNYVTTKGAVQFPIDQPFPRALIKKLVKDRLKQIMEKTKITKKSQAPKVPKMK